MPTLLNGLEPMPGPSSTLPWEQWEPRLTDGRKARRGRWLRPRQVVLTQLRIRQGAKWRWGGAWGKQGEGAGQGDRQQRKGIQKVQRTQPNGREKGEGLLYILYTGLLLCYVWSRHLSKGWPVCTKKFLRGFYLLWMEDICQYESLSRILIKAPVFFKVKLRNSLFHRNTAEGGIFTQDILLLFVWVLLSLSLSALIH